MPTTRGRNQLEHAKAVEWMCAMGIAHGFVLGADDVSLRHMWMNAKKRVDDAMRIEME